MHQHGACTAVTFVSRHIVCILAPKLPLHTMPHFSQHYSVFVCHSNLPTLLQLPVAQLAMLLWLEHHEAMEGSSSSPYKSGCQVWIMWPFSLPWGGAFEALLCYLTGATSLDDTQQINTVLPRTGCGEF